MVLCLKSVIKIYFSEKLCPENQPEKNLIDHRDFYQADKWNRTRFAFSGMSLPLSQGAFCTVCECVRSQEVSCHISASTHLCHFWFLKMFIVPVTQQSSLNQPQWVRFVVQRWIEGWYPRKCDVIAFLKIDCLPHCLCCHDPAATLKPCLLPVLQNNDIPDRVSSTLLFIKVVYCRIVVLDCPRVSFKTVLQRKATAVDVSAAVI